MTYKGVRFQRATGIKIDKSSDLDAKSLTIKGNVQQTNLLRDIENKAQKLFSECRLTERSIDLELIWGCILGIDHFRDKTPSLLGLIAQFEQNQNERYEVGDLSPKSHIKVLRWNRYLSEFVTSTLGKSANIDDIKPAHAQALETWIKNAQNGLPQLHTAHSYTFETNFKLCR